MKQTYIAAAISCTKNCTSIKNHEIRIHGNLKKFAWSLKDPVIFTLDAIFYEKKAQYLLQFKDFVDCVRFRFFREAEEERQAEYVANTARHPGVLFGLIKKYIDDPYILLEVLQNPNCSNDMVEYIIANAHEIQLEKCLMKPCMTKLGLGGL